MICAVEAARGAAEFVPPAHHSHELVGGPTASPPPDLPSGWRVAQETLLKCRSLADDWDGLGAVAPEPALVDGAIALARTLRHWPAPARVHAGVNGTIYFEWYGPSGYTEVEVTHPTSGEHRTIPHGGGKAVIRAFRW